MVRGRLSVIVLVLALGAAAPAADEVKESARRIPVAYEADVVVIGGTTGAVAAASAAAKAGARVFLAAPYPYLGEDMAATLRLWLEAGETPDTPLARKIFSRAASPLEEFGNTLPFRYTTSLRSAGRHRDTSPPSLLCDGRWSTAISESVEYQGDVEVTLDLGKKQRVERAYAMVYHSKDYLFGSVALSVSADGKAWRGVGEKANDQPSLGSDVVPAVVVPFDVGAEVRFLKFAVRRREGATRLLLGEFVVVGPGKKKEKAKPTFPPVRPLHLKRVLDQELLKAGVRFLYCCYPTDVVFDADGKPCGVVVANRAGRQAVLGKVIIDATERAVVARLAGGRFRPFPKGELTVQRVVIGGKPLDDPRVVARSIEPPFRGAGGRGPARPFPITAYTFKLWFRDGSFAARAEAEQKARDLTWHPDQQFASDILFFVPPDPMIGQASQGGEWQGVDALDLGAFRPRGVERLFVVGGCADVSREQAAKLLRPLALIKMGERVGKAAAAEAARLPVPRGAHLPGRQVTPAVEGDVAAFLAGLRPATPAKRTIPQDERPLPVLGRYDVVVIGGGTAGAPAGIAAARQGAKTLVVEMLHGLGGVGTLGAISGYYWGNRVGFSKEVLDGKTRWGIQEKMEWWRRELREAGAHIWFGSIGCGAFVRGGKVAGAVVATPYGRGVVLAKVVIDATGNSDIAAAAGAPCIYTDASDIALQGTGLPPRYLGRNYTNTDFTITDETDMVDVTSLFLYAKLKAGNAFDLGQLIDTRERRRIVGDFTITILDQVLGRTHPDTVIQAYSDFDTHGYTTDPYFTLQHPPRGKGIKTDIPYRALLPRGLDGILVVGLGISAHRDAVPLIRMQPDIQNGGYAAGVAAAMAAKAGGSTRSIDVNALQRHLVKIGNLDPKVLADQDNFPLPRERVEQAVRNLAQGYKDVAVVLAHPQQAIPMLRHAYSAAKDQGQRLIYAHVLATLGDPTGLDALIEAVRKAPDLGKGWHYRGMGQYGRNMSMLDAYVYALGRAGDRRATPVIIEKLERLKPGDAFSHFRAIALALERLRDPRAAEPLAKLLSTPGIRGHAIQSVEQVVQRGKTSRSWTATAPRSNAIRELLLARALFRCGDHHGLGRKVLEEYTRDVRGHLARHAAAILAEARK